MACTSITANHVDQISPTVRPRLNSIDLLRGLVIVLMALDHARDFFGGSGQNPRDIAQPALFLTRWITHFCAPTFILLAGLSAFLYGTRGRSTSEVSWFLFTRGLWLIFIEFTVVNFGWNLTVNGFFIAQVIWAIGSSMIILAALVYLPRRAIVATALVMIAGHDLFDGIRAESLGSAYWLWNILHQPALLEVSSRVKVLVVYPLLPWPAVMAAGYIMGPLYKRSPEHRQLLLLCTGGVFIVGFIGLRASNFYGDPVDWSKQATWLGTLLSFIDCEKYPPSLLFLMMTLGPALILLAVFERTHIMFARSLTTFGRVPFLFYVVHLPLLHTLAVVLAWFTLGDVGWMFGSMVFNKPAGYGLNLFGIYAVWVSVLLMLYPVCSWFAALKARRHDWWLSYL